MTKYQKQLKNWEKETVKLANLFREKYFGQNATDFYWIGDKIGGVYCINDYFFNLEDIVDFLRYEYSEMDMFNYYDYRLKMQENGGQEVIDIKNWRSFKKIIPIPRKITNLKGWKELVKKMNSKKSFSVEDLRTWVSGINNLAKKKK